MERDKFSEKAGGKIVHHVTGVGYVALLNHDRVATANDKPGETASHNITRLDERHMLTTGDLQSFRAGNFLITIDESNRGAVSINGHEAHRHSPPYTSPCDVVTGGFM